MREEKNSVANAAEPTGWPRRRHPDVSSTGRGGAVVSVGWGVTENWGIVSEREVARAWFRDERSGNIDVPLQEVRMRVLNLLTKHPRRAPRDWSSWHRKLRSGR